jgi:hypothetical protein
VIAQFLQQPYDISTIDCKRWACPITWAQFKR